jgi:23S rRNA pseudouridine1911/1915/1917 synthase
MQKGLFHKKYLAILTGILEKKTGIINAPISRKNESIIEREINFETGQNAITKYSVIKEKNNLSLVEFELLTGRTHQIRVHSKYIGHPILGDSLYGTESNLINRQALHAYKIFFLQPISQKEILIEIPLPEDMYNIMS